MCGIVASVSSRGPVDAEALLRATKKLRHRGPDAERVWVAEHARVGLGHARLSIIDLTTGDQPIESEDGSLHIVANGEFYDFEAIRAQLEGHGHTFRTRSDSEIALHLYEDLGARAMHRLRGEFAFAIWDERDRVLFAGRDRFGIKPLYYALHDGACHVASEVKALAELGVPLRWDHETVYDLHRGLMHAPYRSSFEGVYQVPPGCHLISNGSNARILPYWDWDYPKAERTRFDRNPREWVKRLQATLDEAVRLRLRADVPVACYLSGGLDSCAVLGVASRLSARPLRAYTLSFDMADYDERAIAEEQAKLSGAEFFPIDIRSEHLGDHFGDAVYHAERPFANAHAVAKFLLSRAVRDSGVKVVLTGEGADEVFAGYPFFRRDMVLHNTEGQDPETAKGLLARLDEANRVSQGLLLPRGATQALESVKRVLGFTPTIMETWAQQGETMSSLLDDDFKAPFQGRDTFRAVLSHLDVERQLAGRDAVNQSLYIWAKTTFPNYILSNLGDRMEMAHSVEGRLPFLDHHVVAQVTRMPVAMKIQGMTEKYVLREAARPVITDSVYRRQKHPFLSPPSTLQMEGRLFSLVQDTLRGKSLERTGLYDRRRVASLLDAIPSMDAGARTAVDAGLMWMTGMCLIHERLGL
ncbi:MAG: asparagine synthase (glutamine-hydrolyzing) [Acidobacteria bacterium]|nr:asparagine synthase (glutamine-hydrolyzing) [Acidobacteriota bacterium]